MEDEYDFSQSVENPYLNQSEEAATVQAENMSAVRESDPSLQSIAYSLDALIPGFYLWCGPLKIRIGGSLPEDNYPGIIHTWDNPYICRNCLSAAWLQNLQHVSR